MRRFYLAILLMILPLLNLSCIVQTNVTKNDKRVLFTYQNVAGYMSEDILRIKQCESFTKIVFSKFIEQYGYTFDSSKEKSNIGFLYINSNLQKNISVAAAKQSLKTQYQAYKFGFKLTGTKVTLKDDPGMFTLGDENYHSFIMNKKSMVGNFIVTRVGTYVLQVSLLGLYFDDQELLEECFAETIENLRNKANQNSL